MITASLAGLVFDGSDATTSPYTIIPDGLKGWTDGVDTRRENIDRPGAHGAFAMPGHLAGRVITIAGEVYTSSAFEQEHTLGRVTGLLANGDFSQLVVTSSGETQRATVQRNGAPVITRDRWGLLAKYQLSLFAPDPRKYGDQHTFGPASAVTVTNRGNFPALPILHVEGNAPGGYTIAGPGGRLIVINRPLVGGIPHRFEMRTAHLYVGGARVLGGVARADLFTVPPGLPATVMSINAGASLRVVVEDTYI